MSMKKKANISLVVLALLFIAAAICLYLFPGKWWPRMLLYTTEAGLVGALADLFAVTVLFRHPFGWKWVPHTAIIPKNRDKLVDGVVQMVEHQLLNKEMLMEKVKQYELVNSIIDWLEKKRGSEKIADEGWKLLTRFLDKLDIEGISVQLDQHARQGLRKVNLAPYAGSALRWILEGSNFQNWLGGVVEFAAKHAASEETKEAIKDMLSREKKKFVSEGGIFSRWLKGMVVELAESTDAINLDAAAEALYRDLQSFMDDLRSPEHELRVMVESMVYRLSEDLQSNPNVTEAVNAWKEELLDNLSFLPSIQAMLGSIKDMLTSEAEIKYVVQHKRVVNHEDVKQWVIRLIDSFWEWFKTDQRTKDKLELYIQQFIRRMIDSEHALIGMIVRSTLDSFTEQKLVHFIENKVETDLQRIRLNGAFIGASIGAAFYVILHGIYAPLLQLLQ